MAELKDIRVNYNSDSLDKVESCPFEQFENWLEDAFDTDEIIEPNAMTLCTVDSDTPDSKSKPSARIVLLRGFSESGFEFYTNYNSRKGKEIESNNNAALCFYWDKLERQIRIEGEIRYVGETGNIYKRMKDLLKTYNHTFRRSLGKKHYSNEKDYFKASSSKKFSDRIEAELDDYMFKNCEVSFLDVRLGRKELEEFIQDKYKDQLLNVRKKRK